MRPVAVFPGRVEDVLSCASWNGRNLVVYVSESKEIVVLDDTALLSIIPPSSRASETSGCSASIHPETGRIAVYYAGTLTIYEPVELYGESPRWEQAAVSTAVSSCTSLGWVTKSALGLATDAGCLILYDIADQCVLWKQETGLTRIATHPVCHSILNYCPNSSALLYTSVNESTQQAGFPAEYSTGAFLVQNAFFITPMLVGAHTESALFIWDVMRRQLVLSLSKEDGNIIFAAPNADGSIVLRNGNSVATFSSEESHIINSAESDPLPLDATNKCFATVDRILCWNNGLELDIVSRQGAKPELLGAVKGVSCVGGLNLCCSRSTLLAGNTLFNMDYTTTSDVPNCESIIQSEFLDDQTLVVVDHIAEEGSYRLRLIKENQNVWSYKLPSQPKAIGKGAENGDGLIWVVYANSLCEAYNSANGNKVHTKTLSTGHIDDAQTLFGKCVVRTSSQIQVWNLADIDEGARIMDYGDAHISEIRLSPDGFVALSLSDRNSSWIECFDPKCDSTKMSMDAPVVGMAFSMDSKCLAVLTTKTLTVFGIVSEYRGRLVRLAESDARDSCRDLLYFMSGVSALCWSLDSSRIFIFNGRQLLALETSLDAADSQVLRKYAFNVEEKRATLPRTITDLQGILSSPLPLYHPSVLILCLEALKPEIVYNIFEQLERAIKYSDTDESGTVAFLESNLGISELKGVSEFSEARGNELLHLLQKYRLAGLTKEEQSLIQILVSSLLRCKSLDSYALCAYVLHSLPLDLKCEPKIWTYAWFSQTKLQLQNLIEQPQTPRKEEKALPIWLDHADFKSYFEQHAKKKFAETRDPTSVTLFYIALRNLDGLQTLWRIASGHSEREKTMKLLKNDFTTPRWRVAAQKNAYALLSKHRDEYAAAFFLLGDSIKDCCQVCADKLGNMPLAIAVARIYDGDDGEGLRFLQSRYFSAAPDSAETGAQAKYFVWLRFWIRWLLEEYEQGLSELQDSFHVDLSAIFMYALHGGDVARKQAWKRLLAESQVPELIVSEIISPLTSVDLPRSEVKKDQTEAEDRHQETSHTDTTPSDKDEDSVSRSALSNRTAPPSSEQLEPDMSAFGF